MLMLKKSLSSSEKQAWSAFTATARRPASYCFSSLTAFDHLRAQGCVSGSARIKIAKEPFALTYLGRGEDTFAQALGYAVNLPGLMGCKLDVYGLVVKHYDEGEIRSLVDEVLSLANRKNAVSLRFMRTHMVEDDAARFRTLLLKLGFESQDGQVHEGNWIQTAVIDLSGPPEAILSSFRENTRRWIRKAGRAGMQVRLGNEPEYIQSFYRLFRDMHRRKGGGMGLPPITLLESLHDRLMVANAFSANESLLASAVLLEDGITARYNWGASVAESEGAAQLTHFECMKWARERGLRYYDLGGIPIEPQNPFMKGIKFFKEGFRGDQIRLLKPQTLVLRPLVHKSLRLAERVAGMVG